MDDRRKRLKFRAWRRGFREIDLILGGFADRFAADISISEVEAFEALLSQNDQDVYEWIISGAAPPPYDTPLMQRLRAFLPMLPAQVAGTQA